MVRREGAAVSELGIKSKHASLLNDLHAMAQSFAYAARKHVLMQAEGVIVAQELEIERLRQRLKDMAR